jgi:protein SCO1/2
MALVYYKCKMLCPQVLSGLARTLRQVGFTPGKDYDIVVTSIDPADTPVDGAAEKAHFLDSLGAPNAGSSVHFLTGQQASITDLASATGFNYVRVPGPDGKMDQFAHSSVIMIATPDGRMSKYLFGIDYQPRDVRLAVIQASTHHIGSVSDLILLYCCNYSPTAGKYTVSILRVMGRCSCCWQRFTPSPASQSKPPPTPSKRIGVGRVPHVRPSVLRISCRVCWRWRTSCGFP